jgi:ABC-type lipoprotein release transport system permease subunit
MLISQSLKLALIGLAIGVVCAAGVSRMLTALLYEIKPQDPSTFLLVCVGLLFVALAASYTPARRAMKIDPIAALKWE